MLVPAALLGEEACAMGIGGGNGETDNAVTEADGCALYVRRVEKDGMELTCCFGQPGTEELRGSLGAYNVSIMRAYNLPRIQHVSCDLG